MYDQLNCLLQEKYIISEMGFKEGKDSYIKFKTNTTYNFFIINNIEVDSNYNNVMDLEVGLYMHIYGETILNFISMEYRTYLDNVNVHFPCFYVCFKHYDKNYRMDAYIVDLKFNSFPIRYDFSGNVIETFRTNDNIYLRVNVESLSNLNDIDKVVEKEIKQEYKRFKKLILE